MSSNPPIALTMGDPAGIGPEIAVKVAADQDLPVRPVIIGDRESLTRAAKISGINQKIIEINSLAAFNAESGDIQVLRVRDPLPEVEFGRVNAACGQAAYDYIRAAIALAKAGEVSAIVTAPIHKEALAAAGVPYPGHTEMLADFGGAERCAMMLANDELRVVLVTIHCALRDAIDKITVESELEAIRLADEGTRQFGVARPRVAVAGLNPHAGEGGLFGSEEAGVILPAINAAKELGIDVTGPWPGDTVFMQARAGRFDVVVAQYHDQGLIPIKYLGIENGVNVTLGLPFVRTSPDHGTAFDIAGKGIADPASLRMAVIQAQRLVEARKGQQLP